MSMKIIINVMHTVSCVNDELISKKIGHVEFQRFFAKKNSMFVFGLSKSSPDIEIRSRIDLSRIHLQDFE